MRMISSSPRLGFFHQTFQVPKMEVLTYISCMQGSCKGTPTPKIAEKKVQHLHFGVFFAASGQPSSSRTMPVIHNSLHIDLYLLEYPGQQKNWEGNLRWFGWAHGLLRKVGGCRRIFMAKFQDGKKFGTQNLQLLYIWWVCLEILIVGILKLQQHEDWTSRHLTGRVIKKTIPGESLSS